MVLVELSARIHGALLRMSNATAVDEVVLKVCLYNISCALLEADVQFNLVLEIQKNMQSIVDLDDVAAASADGNDRDRIVRQALFDQLCRILDPAGKQLPLGGLSGTPPSVVMFVGLQGSGKTTSCIKYACYHQKKGWKPAIVCADTSPTGAFDQLKQIATRAKIPFYGCYDESSDPVKVAVHGVENCKKNPNCDLIIVDTSGGGSHKQGEGADLFEELRQVSEAINPDLVILVMDASVGQLASAQVEDFKERVAAVGAVIVTKMDAPRTKGAGALCAVAATKTPVIFIGTGEHMDELRIFHVKPFVRRLLCMAALSAVAEKIGQPRLLQKLVHGNFTLRIIREWYQGILNSGPGFEKIIESIGPDGLIPGCNVEESLRMIKVFIATMDSMTAEELDSPDLKLLVNNSPRIMRIARNSGHQVTQVMEMIETFEPLAKKMSRTRGMLTAIGLNRRC